MGAQAANRSGAQATAFNVPKPPMLMPMTYTRRRSTLPSAMRRRMTSTTRPRYSLVQPRSIFSLQVSAPMMTLWGSPLLHILANISSMERPPAGA